MSFRVFYLLSYHLNEPFRLFYSRIVSECNVCTEKRKGIVCVCECNDSIDEDEHYTNISNGLLFFPNTFSRKSTAYTHWKSWTIPFFCCFVFRNFHLYQRDHYPLRHDVNSERFLWSEKQQQKNTRSHTPTIHRHCCLFGKTSNIENLCVSKLVKTSIVFV